MHYSSLTHLEIDHQNILHNLKQFQKCTKAKITPVIKANAYGHGMIEIAQTLQKEKVYKLAVATFNEALILRQNKITIPVIVIGITGTENYTEAASLEIETALYNYQQIEFLEKNPPLSELKIHLKINTGMNRLGFAPQETKNIIARLQNIPQLKIEGMYSHFADAETPENPHTLLQIQNFNEALEQIDTSNIPDIHCAASAATLAHPSSHFTMMRLGIALYGLWPSTETEILAKHSDKIPNITLKPALTWHTHIADILDVKEGKSIGYGRSFTAHKDMTIATLPLGYADGYPRSQSNKGHVIIQNKRCPIVGKVCMNMFMVDISHITNPQINDEVFLINNTITAEEIALNTGTINYEITTRLNWDMPHLHKNIN